MKATLAAMIVWMLLLAANAHSAQLVTIDAAKLLPNSTEVRLEAKIATSTKADFSPILHQFGAWTRVKNACPCHMA